MTPIIVREATRADIASFSAISDIPTVRAIVGEIDGKIVALAGIALGKGRWFAFCDLCEDVRPYKMTIARTAIRFLDECRRDGIRFIYAQASLVEPGAISWLTRLGFTLDPRSQQLYRWSAH